MSQLTQLLSNAVPPTLLPTEVIAGQSSAGMSGLDDQFASVAHFMPDKSVEGQEIVLPAIRDCWWEDVEVSGLPTVEENGFRTATLCRDYCSQDGACDMWVYDEVAGKCYSKGLDGNSTVTLRARDSFVSGRDVCRIAGDYQSYDVWVELIENSYTTGMTIGYIDNVGVKECAVACQKFPRCYGFESTAGNVCKLKGDPIGITPVPDNVPQSRRSIVGRLLAGDPGAGTTSSTTTTTSTTTSSTTTSKIASGPAGATEYGLTHDYRGNDFLDYSQWTWETFNDPTYGYVDYINRDEAQGRGMVTVNQNTKRVILRSESTLQGAGRGRKSIRISSKATFQDGIIVWKIHHMPGGCGNWPALWTVGPNWPNNGEIDVVEGANTQASNNVALHTKQGCSMYGSTLPFDGNWIRYYKDNTEVKNCWARATPENYGCAIASKTPNSFGTQLNTIGGGYFILEMNDSHIKVWFFKHTEVPSEVKTGTIKAGSTNSWPTPQAAFAMGGECNFRNNFKDQVIVINNTFCGGYAGWSFISDGCPDVGGGSQLDKCETFVRTRPDQFREAYWDIEYVRAYGLGRGTKGIAENVEP